MAKLGYTLDEILETVGMVQLDNFDIRTATLGINLLPASNPDPKNLYKRTKRLITTQAKDLASKAETIEKRYGVPIVNKRITVTPAAKVLQASFSGNKEEDKKIAIEFAYILDKAAKELKIDFLGGYGALVDKGIGYSDKVVIETLPKVLNNTKTVCAFVNIASSKSGVNMRAVAKMGTIIHKISQGKNGVLASAKLVVFCNAVSDNPFMAGGFHGTDQPDVVLNIGISGPGVVRRTVESLPTNLPLDKLAQKIQNTAFKITRAGELIGEELAKSLGVRLGSIDLSLAPTPKEGDSVGLILERMGLERVGTHGTTAALALLTDAVKKGGIMASTKVGGLSGAFIPVAEDARLAEAAFKGVLTIDKLEAMTSVCSVGIDMILVPSDTHSSTIAGIIADEAVIGIVNNKTTAVRIIPVAGKKAGELVILGGLFGKSRIIPLHKEKCDKFIWRKGKIPPTITSFKN